MGLWKGSSERCDTREFRCVVMGLFLVERGGMRTLLAPQPESLWDVSVPLEAKELPIEPDLPALDRAVQARLGRACSGRLRWS